MVFHEYNMKHAYDIPSNGGGARAAIRLPPKIFNPPEELHASRGIARLQGSSTPSGEHFFVSIRWTKRLWRPVLPLEEACFASRGPPIPPHSSGWIRGPPEPHLV